MRSMLLIFLLMPALLFAQSNDRRQVESQAFDRAEGIKNRAEDVYWRSGLFGMTPSLALIDFGFDTNVLLRETEEEEDVVASPEFQIETFYSFSPQWIWENTGVYRYRYYTDLDRLRTSEYSLRSNLYGMFRRLFFQAGYNLFEDQGRQSSEQADRVSSNRERFDVELVVQALPKGHVIAKGQLSSLDYENRPELTGFDSLERDEVSVDLSYLHKVRPEFWPFVGVDQRDFDFQTEANPRDESKFTRTYVGFRNEKGGRVHYNLEVGNNDLSFDRASQIDDTIFSASAVVDYRLSRQSSVSFGGFQNPLFSLTREYAYYTSSRLFASLTTRLARDTRLTASVLLGNNGYDNPLEPVDVERDDDVSSLDLRYSFPVARAFSITLETAYEERDSNLAGLSYEGLSLFSDIRYKFR